MTLPVEPEGVWGEKRLAALLMRLLGVYFAASALIAGSEEAVRLFFAIHESNLEEALPKHAFYLLHLGVQLAVGAYLFLDGRWVLEKVLMPMTGSPSEEDRP